jgi:hypothetical protein
VFKIFNRVNLNNRYKAHEPYEILIDKEDMEIEILNNLYIQIKKKYYSNITPFEDVQGDYTICIEKGEKIGSIVNSCALQDGQEYSVVRLTKSKILLNKSDRTNVVKLNDQIIQELLDILNKLNTPLTRCEVGDSSEYSVVISKDKKHLVK